MVTPESAASSPQVKYLEATQSPLDVTTIPQHVSPLDNPSFQMPTKLSFTNQGQQTPEFGSPQPELGHRNLAGTPIAGPLLTPTHNQFMDHSPFAETSPTNYPHTVSTAYAQADPSASFTGWSSASQQNMFLSVNYSNGAGHQMPSHVVYPSYGPYSSPQYVPQPFAVPELSRRGDYDMANMSSLPIRSSSSHPHIVHRRDSGDVNPGM